ncbi:MAG: valine--tRNA ligase [Clostridia bacterium]|nr:valine--tRNA ligase [Clostridia bacterium]
MRKELSKSYDPSAIEDKIFDMWLRGRYFSQEPDTSKKPFSIVIPPPNVTGQLHMGHALDETMQDILTRYKRMSGYAALWILGTDHAGIATQIKVEESLRVNEHITRYDLGREKFLERVWEWKNLYGNRIVSQLKKLGSSCDYENERFTMDEGCSRAVKEVFVNLYNKGLIYQGNRIINWCPRCTTALSDAEVEHKEQDGFFWHIKYPIEGSDDFIEIATTRPETMLGDTAIAVNPEDERYTDLVGKYAILPLVGRRIPIIADEYVDREFGTGCVKITPCHDPNDFEVGLRHDLEQILVMDENGCINKNGGKYEGQDRFTARENIVNDLKAEGLLVDIRPHSHNVGTCYRCGTVVEPMTSKQWFVKMEPLAKDAIRVVKDGEVKFVPDRFTKTYINWMENVHDWCISRQLWWGHRIPAYHCRECGHVTVSKTEVDRCEKCGGAVIQDPDVLDTWFSSALWPFSTLGWPDKTEKLDFFYPTNVLVTGYDIIFFWVARMIFSGLEHTGKPPFSTVLIHGLVRDKYGKKMSKSAGNGIDPLEVIAQYGADALRLTLITGNAPGNDLRFNMDRVEASSNFNNKLWNAARFVLMNLKVEECKLPENLQLEDKWILSKLNTVVKEVCENMDKFELGVAVQKIYDFTWDCFCDWYIELVKPRLYDSNDNNETKESAQYVLLYVLTNILKLLHPFMPFITEEIFSALPRDEEVIITSKFPVYDESLCFPEDERNMQDVMDAVGAVRNIRAEMNVAPSRKAKMTILTKNTAHYESGKPYLQRLAGASEITVIDESVGYSDDDAVNVVTGDAKIFIPLGDLIDFKKELERLNGEKTKLLSELKRVDGKLSNEKFVAKAPPAVVEEERAKKEKYQAMLDSVMQSIAKIEGKA